MNISTTTLASLTMFALVAAGFTLANDARAETFYAAPDGDDRNAGTIDAPWGTLLQSFKRLKPGDELILRGGSYQQDTLYVGLKGEAAAPIVIRNHPGERPVVDGRHLEFLGDQGDQWEPVDSAIHLYRSKETYEEDGLTGNLEQDGELYKLNAYSDFAALIATRQSWSEETPFYVGPGIHHGEDGHIYIRLERPDPEAIFMTPEEIAALPPANPIPTTTACISARNRPACSSSRRLGTSSWRASTSRCSAIACGSRTRAISPSAISRSAVASGR